MKKRKVIVWFRQDLRLHDNEALTEAIEVSDDILPVYIFDTRLFGGKTKFGFKKTEKFRAKFIIESIHDLRENLKKIGTDLYVRVGIPEEEIYQLAKEVRTNWVFCNRERTEEEVLVQDSLEEKLWSVGQEIRYSRGKMLYYTSDLPFPISHTPDTFTHFRKEVEKFVPIREPLPSPKKLNRFSQRMEMGEIPRLEDLGYEGECEIDNRAAIIYEGGETAGLARLKHYTWDSKNISTYKETRNGLLGESYSSKFSTWLSQGCLSPKYIYHEIKKYEAEHGSNDSTYWLVFELLWRDFFRLMGKKYGNAIFQKGGTKQQENGKENEDMSLFKLWREGRTGIPFIDANMRELKTTGFMSNRGRQNVASFLVNDLKMNWQMGAEYFESMLVDYDPCSNWGNWNYIAGVGSDPRENRYFNIVSQAKRYDPQGAYVRHWIPELKDIPNDKIHVPDTLTSKELQAYKFKPGSDYPKAMFSTSRWTK